MKFRLLTGALTAAAVAASVLALGVSHTLVVLAVFAGIAAATAGGTALIIHARSRRPSGPLARQLALVIAMVIVPLLVALTILGLLMFVSGDDAALVGVIVALSGVIGVAAARRLARAVAEDVATIRDGLLAVGRGERDVRLEAMTAVELRDLADAATAMIARLGAEEAARDQSEAARRGGRRQGRGRAAAARVREPDAGPHPGAVGADRRPLRTLPPAGRRHQLDARARRPGRPGQRERRRDAGAGAGEGSARPG